ncbi:MAG TPA: C25 family cysteine peptidase [Anaerolineales bacterium]|nr:C25 family cysteine peptidase [Anaerolineales bacterium]
MIERQDVIHLIQAARVAARYDFARLAAADWLVAWPGDLEVQFLLAQAEVEQGLNQPACARLHSILLADPEYGEAHTLLAVALRASGDAVQAQTHTSCAAILRGESIDPARAPSWAPALVRAVSALAEGNPAEAAAQAHQALSADPGLPLPTLLALKARLAAGERAAAIGLARVGHDRWPECIAFNLLLADEFLQSGQNARAVDYLHGAAAGDPTGAVCSRYLGPEHPYRSLWPTRLSANLSQPIPAEVAAVLGANRLAGAGAAPAGSPQPAIETARQVAVPPSESESARPAPQAADPDPALEAEEPLPEPEPWEAFRGPNPGIAPSRTESRQAGESLREIEKELDRVAARVHVSKRRNDEDRRVPAYIAVSCRTRLVQVFGADRFRRIDDAMMALVETVRRRPGWSAYRVYLDDPACLEPFGLSPADPQNAWQLKLRLADLDAALATRGEMIGSLLIVGGPAIVPFHLLPNPTDDDDDTVPSDNPYSATDDNYFAPEWAVGRLPSDTDADLLTTLLRRAAEDHRAALRRQGLLQRLRLWLASLVGRTSASLGYSASIWRKASMAVYRVIGDPESLITSPPVEAEELPPQAVRPVRLSYFNLHGIEDGAEWFGQRDPLEDQDSAVEYPIALRPQDVVNSGNAPRVVYTEACYGANVAGKTAETALSLKFLASGSRAVVGSTKISYGSVTPPLIAADLLGKSFWDHLNQPLPVGEALRRAKLQLAAEMHRRQGYLDGEDQKTLISFILYGDPLFTQPSSSHKRQDKLILRRVTRPAAVKTACALGGPGLKPEDLDPATVETVRSIVARYLPGLIDAGYRVHSQHCGCEASDHHCPSNQLGIKASQPSGGEPLVVTLSKQISVGERRHAHLARLTLGPSGKVLKLSVSR